MIKFNSSVNINSPESFISEAEKELEKLDIFISPSSFVRQNTPQKKEESFVLKVTTTAITMPKLVSQVLMIL